MNILLAILGLLLLVLIHEAGHFLAAKGVGMRATKFYVGFPPALARVRRGETEYGIGLIPLGGYVKITGMGRPRPQDLRSVRDAVEEAARKRPLDDPDRLGPAYRRAEAALDADDPHGLVERLQELDAAFEQERHLIDPERAEWCEKELARARDDADPRSYWRQPVWKRLIVIAAGPAANVVAAAVILTVYFAAGTPRYAPYVSQVTAGSPARAAGLQSGDVIVRANGERTTDINRIRSVIEQGGPVRLTVRRDGREVQLPPAEPKRIQSCDRCLGFVFGFRRDGTQHYSLPAAASAAGSDLWFTTRATYQALAQVVSGGNRQDLTTPVGIVQVSETSFHEGVYPRLLALISLSLALFNILPFLPLDGGHMLFALIELARRRPVRREVYERVSALGIAAMIMLFFDGLTPDIGRLGSSR